MSGNERKSKINYSQNFFNIEGEKKIAMKLSEDERLAFRKVLGFAFNKLIERRFELGKGFRKLEE